VTFSISYICVSIKPKACHIPCVIFGRNHDFTDSISLLTSLCTQKMNFRYEYYVQIRFLFRMPNAEQLNNTCRLHTTNKLKVIFTVLANYKIDRKSFTRSCEGWKNLYNGSGSFSKQNIKIPSPASSCFLSVLKNSGLSKCLRGAYFSENTFLNE